MSAAGPPRGRLCERGASQAQCARPLALAAADTQTVRTVTAPDLMTGGIGATVVRSAGQMTLYLELWDAATNTIIARVMDAREDDSAFAQRANRVTNKAAADRILREWASKLREHLDAAQGKSTE